MSVYFDHNATAPLLPEVGRAWLEASQRFIGNPASPHRIGARADAALDDARHRLAKILACDALDLVWTSGATESNNTILHHCAAALRKGTEVWASAIEHPCVLEALRKYFPKRHRLIPVTRGGVVDLNWLRQKLRRSRPGLVVLMAANNETGVLQPWREALAICNEREIPLFCDAAQWIGRLPAAGLGACTWLSGCAHKFGGPKGVGFLKCPPRGAVRPLLVGGKQEEGRRAGTENVAGALALVSAIELREAGFTSECPKPKSGTRSQSVAGAVEDRIGWRACFEEGLLKSLPGSVVVGAGLDRLWNTVSALMPQADCQQRWVVKLDKRGFAVSTGSACSSGREEPSHVLRAMGYSAAEAARVLRFSSGWETTEHDWCALLEALKDVQREMGT